MFMGVAVRVAMRMSIAVMVVIMSTGILSLDRVCSRSKSYTISAILSSQIKVALERGNSMQITGSECAAEPPFPEDRELGNLHHSGSLQEDVDDVNAKTIRWIVATDDLVQVEALMFLGEEINEGQKSNV